MSADLLAKWLDHYDPIHRGYTARGLANGVCATNGWCFPRIGGGYNLYRGTPTAGDIDYAQPVGAAGPAAGLTPPVAGGGAPAGIANFSWRPHAVDSEYFYSVRAIGGGGVESPPSERAVAVAFDGSGAYLGGRPNPPVGLSVSLASGGRFVLSWSYSSLHEAAAPVGFRVYSDGGTGAVDYDSALAEVAHASGRVHYRYTTGGHAHGARRLWAVRAVSSLGRDDGNSETVEAVADAQGPEPHPNLVAECVGE